MQRCGYLLNTGTPFLKGSYISSKLVRLDIRASKPYALANTRCFNAAAEDTPSSESEFEKNQPEDQPGIQYIHPSISRWVDLKNQDEKRQYLEHICPSLPQVDPQGILLHYLHRPPSASQVSQEYLNGDGHQALQKVGFGVDDVSRWAWILSGERADVMMERFLRNARSNPTFLLTQILRLDLSNVRPFRDVLIYIWDQIVDTCQPGTPAITSPETNTAPSIAYVASYPWRPSHIVVSRYIIRRLLHHARRIWPAAMPSIAHMLEPLFHDFAARNERPDSVTHQVLSRWRNSIIHELALPASIEPLKSMVYNWNAQKILLGMGEQFEPPLLLNETSYRAVAQVLAASKKSDSESKDVQLRSRSWPPWRQPQDGMDALSLSEESQSRVVLALARMQEAGYPHNAWDKALRILGGQELDLTPTIHTRKILKFRRYDDSEAAPWAARIDATRDVREAWSAFLAYRERNLPPALSVYFAMFIKLHYEEKRIHGIAASAAPGDQRELFPVPDDNTSEYYKSRLQPPSLPEFYADMLATGLRPSGLCLVFLVSHARSIKHGLQLLCDSNVINQRGIACLGGDLRVSDRIPIIEAIPESIFASCITLFCRFAPRINEPVQRREATLIHTKGSENYRSREFIDPLPHAAELLKIRRPTFKPAWYALFRALARHGVIVSRDLARDPKNAFLTWQVLLAALRDFQNCGLELDPQGFLIICHGFVKAVEAADHVRDRRLIVLNSLPTLKIEFQQLTETSPTYHKLPRLLYPISAVHLHTYIRALGVAEDVVEIISVLKWMVDNHNELQFAAQQSRNGPMMLRRTIVAIKVHCSGWKQWKRQEEEAQKLVEGVEWWGGWPGDYETRQYLGLETDENEEDGDEE